MNEDLGFGNYVKYPYVIINMSFSSDSTYCSVYENVNNSHKKCRKSAKARLKIINQEVMLHLQGTKLLDNNNVITFMKETSGLRLTSYKDKYLAEKLKGFLLKIYNFNKKFEDSVNSGKMCQISDPMESFHLSQNMEVMPLFKEEHNLVPLQLLASNPKSSASFPLDILTNQNFEIEDPKLATQGTVQDEIQQCNSVDLFSSQENLQNPINYTSSNDTKTTITLYNSVHDNSSQFDSYSDKLEDGVFKKPFSPVKRKKAKIIESSKQVSSTLLNIHCFDTNSNPSVISESESSSECSFQDNKQEALAVHDCDSNQTVAYYSIVNTEQEQAISNIMDDKFTSVCSQISNIDVHCSKTSPRLTLDVIRQLGTDMYNSYDTKVNRIYSAIGNDVKSWEELSDEIEYTDKLSNHALDTLLRLTNKIKLEDTIDTEKDFEQLSPSIHNFDPDEEEELDLRNVMEDNKEKLQAIAQEFKTNTSWLINQPDLIEENDNDDYNLLDWRVLLD